MIHKKNRTCEFKNWLFVELLTITEIFEKEIATVIAQAFQKIQEVNQNVNQSSTVVSEITNDIAMVDHSSSEIANSSDRMKIRADALEEMAEELNIIVESFKV